MFETVFTAARQEIEAELPQWQKIHTPLQLLIASNTQEELWLYSPKPSAVLRRIEALNPELPTAKLSETTLHALFEGKKNLQQCFLDEELQLTGEASAVLYFTRFFALLIEIARR